MAWSVDWFGRSLQHLISFLSELHALGIDLILHQQRLDTATPSGKAMFQMMGVFKAKGNAWWSRSHLAGQSPLAPNRACASRH